MCRYNHKMSKKLYAVLSFSPIFWIIFLGPLDLLIPDGVRNSNLMMYIFVGTSIGFLILIPCVIAMTVRHIWKTRKNSPLLVFVIANAVLFPVHLIVMFLLLSGIGEH